VGADSVERVVFTRRSGGRLQLGIAAMTEMHRHRQDKLSKPEAGGVLLGRHIQDTNDLVVDRVTSPMLGDRRSRFRYFRSRRPHQAEIDRAWQESGGTTTYLGEWHTHPEPQPRPSLTDLLDWQRKLLLDRFTDSIFFIIVGTAEMRAWEGYRYGRLMRLRRA
jgi:integrative and conjugative element protein (TIGR02256 family)